MAAKKNNDNKDKNKSKKDKSDGLKSWLSTDDWLGVGTDSVPIPGANPATTPPPVGELDRTAELLAQPESQFIKEILSDVGGTIVPSDGPGSVLPLGAEKSEQSQMRVSEMPSSARIAKGDLAELTAAMKVPDPDSDDAIDLATPPDASLAGPPSLSKIMKASGAKSDILRGAALPKSAESSDIHSGGFNPTGPGSGWLGGSAARMAPPVKPAGSQADIGKTAAKSNEEISDIFSGARHSDAGKDGTGSNLLPGMSGIGRSSVFADPSRSHLGGESDLFGGLTGGSGDRGSSLYDDPAKRTQRVPPTKDPTDIFRNPPKPSDDDGDPSGDVPLIDEEYFKEATVFDERPYIRTPGPESSARLADRLMADLHSDSSSGNSSGSGNSRPDYNRTDKSPGGSNLFDDVTALDIDLASEPGASGVNWLDPNRTGAQDSGPGSSIFIQPGAPDDPSGPGRVDLNQIPLLGSTDDPADMVPNDAYAGPASSVLKKEIDKTMRELTGGGAGSVSFELPDTGTLAWGAPQSALADQVSMRMPVSDDELDLAAPPSGSNVGFAKRKQKKDSDSVFDDSPDFPEGSAIGLGEGLSGVLTERQSASMSGSILQGMTSDKMRSPAMAETVQKTRLGTPTPTLSSQEFEMLPETAPRAKRGGLLITAASLLLGIAAGAAGMYFGRPNDDTKPLAKNVGVADTAAKKSDLGEGNRLLATGDAPGALAVFTQVGDESPEARTGRGQARWMAKLREVAATGGKLSPQDLDVNAARADLKSVVDMADRLQTPEEKQALLKAALNLGLILEATQKPDEAKKLYASMATKYASQPNFKKVFDSAVRRVTYMQKDGSDKPIADDKYSLAPEMLRDLGIANLIVLEFDAVQPSIDEAGFHFWDATHFAATNDYRKAADSLNKAKVAHEKQRKLKVGMGLNPISDPTEQLFLRACNELGQYYALKGRIYDDPIAGALAKKGPTGVTVTLDKMLAALKQADTFATELAAETKKIEVAQKAATAATAAKVNAEKEVASLKQGETKLKELLETTTAKVTDLTKAVDAAKVEGTAAADKLKLAEAALDPVIAKLKAAKLIDDKATRDQALAALPELAKKPNFMAGGTGTNAEMAKELVALRESAKKEKDDADKKIADLTALTKDAKTQMDVAVKKAERETTQIYADKLAAAELTAKRNQELADASQKQAEVKLTQQAEAFRSQIAAARAGAAVTITDVEREAIDQAAKAYGLGLEAYNGNRNGDAESFFALASRKNANDARYWYYLGLAKARQGKDAAADFDKGARLEARGLPSVTAVNADLVTVQGSLRQTLDSVRP